MLSFKNQFSFTVSLKLVYVTDRVIFNVWSASFVKGVIYSLYGQYISADNVCFTETNIKIFVQKKI